MKRLFIIIAIITGSSSLLLAQQPTRTPMMTRGTERQQQQEETKSQLSVRAQNMNEQMNQEVGNARWMRVIYRELDLTKEENAPLYYPTRPINNQMNLFSTIFNLITEGSIPAYKYYDGYESFGEDDKIDFKEMLNSFDIYYEEIPGRRGEDSSFVILESDIPSELVTSYYVKEAWYFDQNNSLFDVKTLAICPRMNIITDYSGEETSPMFWIEYDDLRPYINKSYIMTSNLNNAKTFTIDDYFRRRMFEGDIIKTENLMNLNLIQMTAQNPDSLEVERKKIEDQLTAFEQSLWFQPDTTAVVTDKKAKKASTRSARTTTAKAEKTPKAPKAETPKAERATPTRTIRR